MARPKSTTELGWGEARFSSMPSEAQVMNDEDERSEHDYRGITSGWTESMSLRA